MKNSCTKYTNIGFIFLGLLVLGAIFIFSPVCQDKVELANGNMTYMRCFYTGQASILLSIVLIVMGIESFFVKSIRAWSVIAVGIMLILSTSSTSLGIGLCGNTSMSCHSTAIWIRGVGIISTLCGVISLFRRNSIWLK